MCMDIKCLIGHKLVNRRFVNSIQYSSSISDNSANMETCLKLLSCISGAICHIGVNKTLPGIPFFFFEYNKTIYVCHLNGVDRNKNNCVT